jgi:adenine-specific DNA-methyltransferase
MRYFGSKFSTLDQLGEIIRTRVAHGTFCDAFGGIGTVGAYFKSFGYRVWTADVLFFAHCFQIARLRRQRLPAFRRVKAELGLRTLDEVMDALNGGRRDNGWFVTRYAHERKFFTLDNARSIDRIWKNIRAWRKHGWLTESEHSVLMASLIHAMDQIANTAGTYYAYLKSWHRKAERPFVFKLIKPAIGTYSGHCHFGSAQQLVAKRKFDILYLDPPYNERSYAHYYHLPETIASGSYREVSGISGVPVKGAQRSVFNDPKNATTALRELLAVARFKILAFHYADNGLIPRKKIRAVLSEYGRLEEFLIQSRGYTTDKKARQVPHRLYLLTHA